MAYSPLIDNLAAAAGISASQADSMLRALASVIASEAQNANSVAIPGFGTFSATKHDEEIIDDLSTGRRLLLPPSIELTFSPGTSLKKSV